MPFQPVENCALATVIWTRNNQRCTMSFAAAHAGAYDQALIDSLALNMDVWAVNEFLQILVTTDRYEGVDVRGLANAIDLSSEVFTNAQAGAAAALPLANSLCVAVKRSTGLTGRSARGRVYVPLHVSMVDANEDFITTTHQAVIEDALNEVAGQMANAGWIHVVISRQTGGVVLEEGVARAVTGYAMTDREIDTQRRRMPTK